MEAIALSEKPKSNRRPAVNLSLSPATIRRGRQLQRVLNRPSLSNVVEHLIHQENQRIKGQAV